MPKKHRNRTKRTENTVPHATSMPQSLSQSSNQAGSKDQTPSSSTQTNLKSEYLRFSQPSFSAGTIYQKIQNEAKAAANTSESEGRAIATETITERKESEDQTIPEMTSESSNEPNIATEPGFKHRETDPDKYPNDCELLKDGEPVAKSESEHKDSKDEGIIGTENRTWESGSITSSVSRTTPGPGVPFSFSRDTSSVGAQFQAPVSALELASRTHITPKIIKEQMTPTSHERPRHYCIGEVLDLAKTNFRGEEYFSEIRLAELVKSEWIENAFMNFAPRNSDNLGHLYTTKTVKDNAGLRITCAILTLMGQLPIVGDFAKEGLDDARIPLEDDALHRYAEKYKWPLFTARIFYRKQFLRAHKFKYDLSIQTLKPETVLPIMKQDLPSNESLGLQGRMYCITIDPEFDDFYGTKKESPQSYAMKVSKYSEQEATILSLFAGKPNIIPLLCSFCHRGEYYLVFPWAEHDLDVYLRRTSYPQTFTKRYVLLHGISKLVNGIHALHSEHRIYRNGGVPLDLRCLHRDLSPANILKLKDEWVIADLGLSTVEEMEPDFESRESGTVQDMYELGWVFLQVAAYAHGGSTWRAKLTSVAVNTTQNWNNLSNDSEVIQSREVFSISPQRRLNPKIIKKIEKLKKVCDPMIRDFIGISLKMTNETLGVTGANLEGSSNGLLSYQKKFEELFLNYGKLLPEVSDDPDPFAMADTDAYSRDDPNLKSLLQSMDTVLFVDNFDSMLSKDMAHTECALKRIGNLMVEFDLPFRAFLFTDDIKTSGRVLMSVEDMKNVITAMHEDHSASKKQPVQQKLFRRLLNEHISKLSVVRNETTSDTDSTTQLCILVISNGFSFFRPKSLSQLGRGWQTVFKQAEQDLEAVSAESHSIIIYFLQIGEDEMKKEAFARWSTGSYSKQMKKKDTPAWHRKLRILSTNCFPPNLDPDPTRESDNAWAQHFLHILTTAIEGGP